MRRRNRVPRENHDRWLVSYADFVTLLFAFFVVMFATARTNQAHVRAVSLSIENALRSGTQKDLNKLLQAQKIPVSQLSKADDLGAPPEQDLAPSLAALQESLKDEIAQGSVRLSLQKRGLVVELSAGAFFAVGDDSIHGEAMPVLERLTAVLNTLPNSLRLEGHTDSLPIKNGRFHSNWELSAARSIAMLKTFDERYGVDPRRMAIVGYGDTVELASNETEEGRTRNRRVDIVILNEQGMKVEPPQTARNLLTHN
jgi:chemotaxis protein MotB